MTATLKPSDFYSLYSPSLCELRLYLTHEGFQPSPPGAFVQLLFQLGQRHEKDHLATFPVFSDLTGAPPDKTIEEIRKQSPVIYQGELRYQIQIDNRMIEVVGIPDFLIKEPHGYVIRDSKLARHATEKDHPEIPRQLQVYGWLFEKTTGKKPVRLEVLKGDGAIESMDYVGEDVVLSCMRSLLDIMSLPEEPYSPVGWSKCGGCGYNDYCMSRAKENQDVALVYDLDQGLARRLRDLGVSTIQELVSKYDENSLSELKRPWGAREQKVGKKAGGILLQAQAMLDKKERVLKKPELPVSQNYVMFDLEGLPPQLDELDKIYLWGMQVFGEKPGRFLYALAETVPDSDKKCWEDFLKIVGEIFSEYGDIPFVHWHHYEKTKIKTYIERYGDRDGIAEKVLGQLIDLLPITRDAVIIPEPSYSLKVVEKYIGFKRTQDEYGGDWSIAKYIEAVETEDEAERSDIINQIIKYNEEDLRATWAVFEWLGSVISPQVFPELRNMREMTEGHSYEHDVFICHASEDKDSFVRPLAEELSARGLHVWYDEFSLRVGDSLRRSIERGLTNSRYGIVVLSPDFFKKEWPQKELDGLNALEDGERKVILPIWHEIAKCDVLRYSPILADRVAINSSSGIEQVVSELLKVVRPKDKYEKLLEGAILKWVAHGILPSVEELYILCENINPDQLKRDEMAFLYCAYLSRDDELIDWTENKRPVFSFGYLRGYLFKEVNFEGCILSSFQIIRSGIGMIGNNGAIGMHGCSASQIRSELKGIVLYEMKVKEAIGEAPAIYFCVQDLDDSGLEILLVRGNTLKSFVRYIPQMSDEEMRQMSLRLIDLEGDE